MPKAQTGQKKFRSTKSQRELVENASKQGLPMDLICSMVENPHTKKPISRPTLYKHFKKQLDTGRVGSGGTISDLLFMSAKKGNVTAQIWLSKIFLKWKETSVLEVDDIDKKAVRKALFAKFGVDDRFDHIDPEAEDAETD